MTCWFKNLCRNEKNSGNKIGLKKKKKLEDSIWFEDLQLSYDNSVVLPIMQSTTTCTLSQGKRTRIQLSQVICFQYCMNGSQNALIFPTNVRKKPYLPRRMRGWVAMERWLTGVNWINGKDGKHSDWTERWKAVTHFAAFSVPKRVEVACE